MGRRDEIGSRGEALFTAAIMSFFGRERPYFVPHFLGDKFQTLDFLVELIGAKGSPYLFTQVKTTTQGYEMIGGELRLRVRLKKADAHRMRDYPAPTYLVGIDEISERSFIVSIDQTIKAGLSGMPTRYALEEANLRTLWDEVNAYWTSRDMRVRKSAFSL